jgi:hypothetical protein
MLLLLRLCQPRATGSQPTKSAAATFVPANSRQQQHSPRRLLPRSSRQASNGQCLTQQHRQQRLLRLGAQAESDLRRQQVLLLLLLLHLAVTNRSTVLVLSHCRRGGSRMLPNHSSNDSVSSSSSPRMLM